MTRPGDPEDFWNVFAEGIGAAPSGCASVEDEHPVSETCDCAACLNAMGTYKPGHSGGFPW